MEVFLLAVCEMKSPDQREHALEQISTRHFWESMGSTLQCVLGEEIPKWKMVWFTKEDRPRRSPVD
jgi:hypothetical protein